MRSSKSRSRSKNNRSRSVGNIINRVFESSGPEGKVRGTPQQVIDKYNQLARDAMLANDRVAAENFQQHAEHYTRILAEAQREIEARRLQQEAEQRERQQSREEQRRERLERQEEMQAQSAAEATPAAEEGSVSEADVIDTGGEADSGLVETPESGGKKRSSGSRSRRKSSDEGTSDENAEARPTPPEAAE